MPILTTYESDFRRLEQEMSGVITFEELSEHRFSDRLKYPAIDSCIYNLLAVERIDLNIAGASSLGEVTKKLPPHLIAKREALVSNHQDWIGLGVVYGTIEIPDREFRPFRDLEKAREWARRIEVRPSESPDPI